MPFVITSKVYACVAPVGVYSTMGLWVPIIYYWFDSFLAQILYHQPTATLIPYVEAAMFFVLNIIISAFRHIRKIAESDY